MAEIIEPHPKLIEYYTIVRNLWSEPDELCIYKDIKKPSLRGFFIL